jgi:hypothetical protein
MASCLWGDVAGMQPAPLMRSSSRLRRAREWRLPTVTDGRGAEPWVRCRGAETADRPRATCIRAASGCLRHSLRLRWFWPPQRFAADRSSDPPTPLCLPYRLRAVEMSPRLSQSLPGATTCRDRRIHAFRSSVEGRADWCDLASRRSAAPSSTPRSWWWAKWRPTGSERAQSRHQRDHLT